MTKRKLAIIGHFGFCGEFLDGQTVKTRIVGDELKRKLGEDEVRCIDSHGGFRFLLSFFWKGWNALRSCEIVIILPGENGLCVIPPVLLFYNLFFSRKIHYVVIGGWLPVKTADSRFFRWLLKKLDGIHVETQRMKDVLEEQGFQNIHIMPNIKRLPIIKASDLPLFDKKPLPLCTFSRVMKSKGIEEAAEAVRRCNQQLGYQAYLLDVYGQIEEKEWFDKLQSSYADVMTYRGSVAYDKSVEVLSRYYVMLFPTYYPGECFAGSLLDAFASGVPVVASDWHDNASIVAHGKTGWIVPVGDVDAIKDILAGIANADLQEVREACLLKAHDNSPEVVINELLNKIL